MTKHTEDIPEWSDADFAAARWEEPRSTKKRIPINLARNIIDSFKRAGERGYQSRINAVLANYVEARQAEQPKDDADC